MPAALISGHLKYTRFRANPSILIESRKGPKRGQNP